MTQNDKTTKIEASEESDLSLTLDNPEGEAEQAYLEEAGTLIFRSALMRYLVDITEEDAQELEYFIEKHIESEALIEKMCEKYPDFKEILEQEATAFGAEMNSV